MPGTHPPPAGDASSRPGIRGTSSCAPRRPPTCRPWPRSTTTPCCTRSPPSTSSRSHPSCSPTGSPAPDPATTSSSPRRAAAWSAWRMPPPTARARRTTAPARPRSTSPRTPAVAGIGRALYDELLAPGRRRRHPRLPGGHRPAEPRERGAARGPLGFERVGTLREVGRKFDRWVDTTWWQRVRAVAGRTWRTTRPARRTRSDPRRYAAHMGAIGSGPFENDEALDFLAEVGELPAADRGHRVLEALDDVLLATGLRRGARDVRGRRRCRRGRRLGQPRRRRRRALPARLAGHRTAADRRRGARREGAPGAAPRGALQDNEWWELWDEAGLAADVTASCRRALAWLGDRDD